MREDGCSHWALWLYTGSLHTSKWFKDGGSTYCHFVSIGECLLLCQPYSIEDHC